MAGATSRPLVEFLYFGEDPGNVRRMRERNGDALAGPPEEDMRSNSALVCAFVQVELE